MNKKYLSYATGWVQETAYVCSHITNIIVHVKISKWPNAAVKQQKTQAA